MNILNLERSIKGLVFSLGCSRCLINGANRVLDSNFRHQRNDQLTPLENSILGTGLYNHTNVNATEYTLMLQKSVNKGFNVCYAAWNYG